VPRGWVGSKEICFGRRSGEIGQDVKPLMLEILPYINIMGSLIAFIDNFRPPFQVGRRKRYIVGYAISIMVTLLM